jgi:hypothetical protein
MIFADLYRLIASCWVAEIENHHMQYSWIEAYWQKQSKLNMFSMCFMRCKFPSAKLDADMLNLHSSRIKVGSYHQLIAEAQSFLYQDRRAPREVRDTYKSLRQDFDIVKAAMYRLEERNTKVIDYLKSLSDSLSTKQSMRQSLFGLFISLWALIYGSYSLISAILGTKSTLSKDNQQFSLYWKIAVPFFATSLFIMSVVYCCISERENRVRQRNLNYVWA